MGSFGTAMFLWDVLSSVVLMHKFSMIGRLSSRLITAILLKSFTLAGLQFNAIERYYYNPMFEMW